MLKSTHTKIGTPHEKEPIPCKRKKFADLAYLNVAASFRFSPVLLPIVEVTIQDKNRNLGKATWLNLQELAKPLTYSLVQGALHWWVGINFDYTNDPQVNRSMHMTIMHYHGNQLAVRGMIL